MIRAVLFDFGGVIVDGPWDGFARYERDNGVPPGFIRRVNATNPDDNAWARLERGEVDLDGFADLFESEARELGHEVDGRAVLAQLVGGGSAGRVRPQMVDALRRCSERLVTGLLTNNFLTGAGGDGEGWGEGPYAEVLALFDAIVESSRTGVRKPDPRFYELACELLEIEPPEAVFLDDLGVNLKPARAMGMTTIKVGDPDQAIADLEEVVGFTLT
ncbi:MAG TPA: HAD-IA family hydrolase [Acidimicrobiales bacterium]|nr:HAD-IA family hydrolase [Acidimicrobiales bacterium]